MSARKVGGEKTAAQVRHVFVVSRAQMHDGLGSQTVIGFFPNLTLFCQTIYMPFFFNSAKHKRYMADNFSECP